MPGFGPNTPLQDRSVKKAPHDSFEDLETATFSPLRYFLEPIAVALNHLTRRQTYRDIRMIGISGGGWTTTLYAAIDPRIRVSYPVAGSLPLFLRTADCGSHEMGDWEQSRSGLYAFVDYTELYVLGAFGKNRQQIQIFNEFDACCFWGLRYQIYEPEVRRVLAELGGGSFQVMLDNSTYRQHRITPWVLGQILASP